MIRNNVFITFTLILATSIALTLPGCTPPENQNPLPATPPLATQPISNAQDYQKYVNTKYRFSVEYPAGWISKEGYLGSVAVFLGPKLPDEYTINMSIFAISLSTYNLASLEDYIKWRKIQINNSLKNMKITGEQNILIDGLPAMILTISGGVSSKDAEYKLEDKLALFVKDSIGYSINLDSTQAFAEKYVNSFNKAVSSFKFDATGEVALSTINYSNAKYGFSFRYPANWGTMEDYRGCPVVLIGPKSPEGRMPAISMEIMTPTNKELPFTLDDFLKLQKLQANRILTDFKILEEHSTVIGKQPAIITTFTGKVMANNTEVKLKDVGASFVKNGIGYSITLDCVEVLTDNNIKYFYLVASSFKFDTE